MSIYTVGCSTLNINEFIKLLKLHNINCLVDVRSTPFSKYTTQFNKEYLQKELKQNNIQYLWMGKEFGARRENRNLYSSEGYLDFEKVRKDGEFLNGVGRIKNGLSRGYTISLMCTEKDPIDCHRTILVAKGLEENGISVKHILSNGKTIGKYELETRLLNMYYKDRNQINFDMLLGNSLTEDEMIDESYRKRNKEIGYEMSEG